MGFKPRRDSFKYSTPVVHSIKDYNVFEVLLRRQKNPNMIRSMGKCLRPPEPKSILYYRVVQGRFILSETGMPECNHVPGYPWLPDRLFMYEFCV